ncbi:MAG: toll/interleukin-1 receptor domain-containing protein, partial [bacterium]
MPDAMPAAMSDAMKVFISHSSRDKPVVEPLARYLRSVGIDAWLDKWEIAPGDDIIAKIN